MLRVFPALSRQKKAFRMKLVKVLPISNRKPAEDANEGHRTEFINLSGWHLLRKCSAGKKRVLEEIDRDV